MGETLVKKNANLDHTIKLVIDRVNMDWIRQFSGEVCKELNSDDPNRLAFLKRLQDYTNRNVIDKLDGEEADGITPREVVLCPESTISKGYGDCKKKTVIIASALKRAGIPCYIKHVFYHDKLFTHVYPIVPYPCEKGYITLDAMENKTFDKEVNYKHANVYDLNGNKMNLYTGASNNGTMHSGKYSFKDIAGSGAMKFLEQVDTTAGRGCCGSPEEQSILESIFNSEPILISGVWDSRSQMGRKSKEERKENRKKLLDKFKGVGLAIPRAAFLTLIAANVFKLASRFLKAFKKDKGRMESFWSNLGGDPVALKKAIEVGAKEKGVSGTIGALGAALAAAAATATPIVIKAVEFLKELKISEGAEDDRALDEGLEDSETEATKPTFVMPKAVAVPAFASKPTTTTPGQPTQGGIGITELNSWIELFGTLLISGKYSMAMTLAGLNPVIASGLCVVGTFYMARKFLASKIRIAFS